MKLNYQKLKIKTNLIKSATGLSLKEFDSLLPTFEQFWERHISQYTFEGLPRSRARKVRINSTFKSTADMLIFILYDYRHNPTQEFMGLHFDLPQPKVAMWLKVLDPLLIKSLKKLGLTPQRDNEGLDNRMIDAVTILMDGSERPINRPKYDQEEYYSGKKSNIQ
jgi:hypothetical protein